MPAYPVRCIACGKRDEQIHPMPKGGGPPDFDRCASCACEVERVFTPVHEISDNIFTPRWDSSLSLGADPVLINTKADQRALMEKRGVRIMERGEARDQARFERERATTVMRQTADAHGERFAKAFDKAYQRLGGM